MKRTLTMLLVCCLLSWASHAQFVTGNSLYVKIGTIFSVDSLVFIPTEDLNLGSNYSLQVDHTAVPGNPNASIKKKYKFNIPVNFEGNLGVIYDPAQLNGNTEALLEIANSMSDETAFVTFTGSVRDLNKHLVSKDVNGLDIGMLTLVNGQSALPVTLIAFEVLKQEQAVKLSWKTSSEANSDFFEIQRSHNAKDWKSLGRVQSAGDSKEQVVYEYTDNGPMGGNNYYRLKMVDRDGTFAFSQIKMVEWNVNALTVYPNPTVDRLEMDVKDWSKVANIKVMNVEGRIVGERKQVAGPGEKHLSLTGFKAGNYILQIEYLDGSFDRANFVKY